MAQVRQGNLRMDIPAGTTDVLTASTDISIPTPATIKLTPGSGGTMLCEYRLHADDAWTAWPAGTVSTATVYQLNGPVQALRFTATTAAGVAYVAQ